jgi:hypothetical protein
MSPTYETYPANHILLDLIVQTLAEECKLWTFSVCDVTLPSVQMMCPIRITSGLPNILTDTFSSLPQAFQANFWTVLLKRSWPHPSKYFTHDSPSYSQLIIPYINSEVQTESLNDVTTDQNQFGMKIR